MHPRRPRSSFKLAALTALAAIWAACSVYPDSLLSPKPGGSAGASAGGEGGESAVGGSAGNVGQAGMTGGSGETGAGAAGESSGGSAGASAPAKPGMGWWSKKSAEGCDSTGLPTVADRPAPPAEDTTLEPIYFALTKLFLGSMTLENVESDTAWLDFGLDLDGLCTRNADCEAADSNKGSCKPTGVALPYDGNNCRDNTFGRFEYFTVKLKEVGGKYHLNDNYFNCGLCAGYHNIIIKISGYNGQPNDDQVRLDLYSSPGTTSPLPFNCDDTSWTTGLCWRTEDQWLIDPASMAAPADGPNLPDAVQTTVDGYVREGVVVGFLPEKVQFRFPNPPNTPGRYRFFAPTLTNGIVVASIKKSKEDLWELTQGTFAGRLTEADTIKGFRNIGLCEADPFYTQVLQYIHNNLDISSDPSAGVDATCDSLSMGVVFDAKQATAGPLATPEQIEPLTDCPPVQ